MDASLWKKPFVSCSSCGLNKEYVELFGGFRCPDCENVLNSTVAVCRATNSTPAKKRAVADVGPKRSSLSALAALLRGGAASGGAQESVPASSGAATATAVPAEAAAATRALAVSEVSSEQQL